MIPRLEKLLAERKLENPQEVGIGMLDVNGSTEIIQAAIDGQEKTVKALIMAKADLNVKNAQGDTALISASWSNHSKVVEALIAARAELNIQGEYGFTALLAASWKGYGEIVQILIAARADLNIMTDAGDTAFKIAIIKDKRSIATFLLNAGAIPPKELYEHIVDCDQRDPDVLSHLQILCQQQRKLRSEEKNHDQKLNDDDYRKAKTYLKKLETLEKLCIKNDESRKTLFNIIDDNINIEIKETGNKKKMPEVLINLITDYYHPPLTNLPFFKASGIDKLLVDNSLSTSKKRK